MRQMIPAILLVLVVGGCAAQKPRVSQSPYGNGVTHSEPVFYNGKHYKVSLRYNAGLNVYAVAVRGKGGRKLGGTPGDRKIVADMARSAVAHFGCARGQKAAIVPGTPRHAAGIWHMQAKCA